MTAPPPIALLAALPIEMGPLKRRLNLTGKHLLRGQVAQQPIVARVTGIGPARALAGLDQLLSRHRPRLVIHFGLAGGLNPNLAAATVLRIARVINARGHVIHLTDEYATACLLTVDQPVTTIDQKIRLFQAHRADAVDMETYAIADRLRHGPARLIALRAISDPADCPLPPAIIRTLHPDGSPNPLAIAALLLRRPAVLPALVRLQRTSSRAADKLAHTVGRILIHESASPTE